MGFTLVEMLIVVSIIGLFLSMSAQRSSISLERSRDAALMGEVHHMRNAIQQYALDHKGVLPPDLAALQNTYLKNYSTNWVGGRSRGVIHYSPEDGSIQLYRVNESGPETLPDSKGRPYAEY